jgi:hypothetical protein
MSDRLIKNLPRFGPINSEPDGEKKLTSPSSHDMIFFPAVDFFSPSPVIIIISLDTAESRWYSDSCGTRRNLIFFARECNLGIWRSVWVFEWAWRARCLCGPISMQIALATPHSLSRAELGALLGIHKYSVPRDARSKSAFIKLYFCRHFLSHCCECKIWTEILMMLLPTLWNQLAISRSHLSLRVLTVLKCVILLNEKKLVLSTTPVPVNPQSHNIKYLSSFLCIQVKSCYYLFGGFDSSSQFMDSTIIGVFFIASKTFSCYCGFYAWNDYNWSTECCK